MANSDRKFDFNVRLIVSALGFWIFLPLSTAQFQDLRQNGSGSDGNYIDVDVLLDKFLIIFGISIAMWCLCWCFCQQCRRTDDEIFEHVRARNEASHVLQCSGNDNIRRANIATVPPVPATNNVIGANRVAIWTRHQQPSSSQNKHAISDFPPQYFPPPSYSECVLNNINTDSVLLYM